jgi:hypothetical protein
MCLVEKLTENNLTISRRTLAREQGKKHRRCEHRRGFLTQFPVKRASEMPSY